jgi:hypothetical protein
LDTRQQFLATKGVAASFSSTDLIFGSGHLRSLTRRLRVPKFPVTLRKSFGFGSTAMAKNSFDDQALTLSFLVVRTHHAATQPTAAGFTALDTGHVNRVPLSGSVLQRL